MCDRLHYSPQALLDLDEIFDYFADELSDRDGGGRTVRGILDAVGRLPGRATRFPLVPPLPLVTDEYRFLAVGSYIAFFRVVGDDIYIDRILHGHRDFAALLGRPPAEG